MSGRQVLEDAFLAATGWSAADRCHLAGDASDRRYARLVLGADRAVLMDAPPGIADDTVTFARIARHLAHLGLSSPAILAEDHEGGFLLLEDLGNGLFSRLIAADPELEQPLYAAATDVLLHLQSKAAPTGLSDPSARDWAEAAAFALSWYAFAATGFAPDTREFVTTLERLLQRHADRQRVLILRDYHAENLLWLPERTGVARVGLLDFQLAQMGQPGYDLVSLLQDARRDVAPATEAAMIARFCAARGERVDDFTQAYAALGTQRALRILGVFARLCLKGGKAGYVALIPRVWRQLQRNLEHPALAGFATICGALLPSPEADILERIRAQCGLHPHR